METKPVPTVKIVMEPISRCHVKPRPCCGDQSLASVCFGWVPENWFYKLVVYTYIDDGLPLFYYGICEGIDICHENCMNIWCTIFLFPIYILPLILLCQTVEILFGTIQLIVGTIQLLMSVFFMLIYRIEGTSPLLISMLYIWRGFCRITFVLMFLGYLTNYKGLFTGQYCKYKIWFNNVHAKVPKYTLKTRKEFLTDLNPYAMEWMFEENGRFNTMDTFAMIPILGIIPGILRLIMVIPLFLFAIPHSMFCIRINKLSYCKIFTIYTISGLCSCSVILSPINYILYHQFKRVSN